ncbi:MAG: methylated-DNA--[protein]-cysteine S-methyltransferase [Clostridia bacterium]
MKHAVLVNTPIGWMALTEEDGALVRADFSATPPDKVELLETPLLARAAQELAQYFAGGREAFAVPLHPHGTPFQLRCWAALQQIPYGQTRSYQEQAVMIDNPRACRAVGMANHCNPLPIFIPCHRVVGKNGALIGYGGGLSIKERLLRLESHR